MPADLKRGQEFILEGMTCLCIRVDFDTVFFVPLGNGRIWGVKERLIKNHYQILERREAREAITI